MRNAPERVYIESHRVGTRPRSTICMYNDVLFCRLPCRNNLGVFISSFCVFVSFLFLC